MTEVQTDEETALAGTPLLTEPSPPSPVAKSRYDRSIVAGPLARAVWKIAWPTMLTNAIGGLQGMVDHILVGNLVGYTGPMPRSAWPGRFFSSSSFSSLHSSRA